MCDYYLQVLEWTLQAQHVLNPSVKVFVMCVCSYITIQYQPKVWTHLLARLVLYVITDIDAESVGLNKVVIVNAFLAMTMYCILTTMLNKNIKPSHLGKESLVDCGYTIYAFSFDLLQDVGLHQAVLHGCR